MAFQGYADFNHLQNVMRENTQNSDEKKTKEKSAKTGLAASAPGGTTKKKEGKKKKATKAGSAATTSKMLSTQTGETLNAVTTAPTGKKKPKKGKKYGFGNCDGDAGTKSTTKKGGVGKKKTSAAPGSSTKEKETEKQKQKRKKLLQQKRKKDSADEQFDGFGDDGDWSDGDGGDAAGAGSVASTNALGIPPLLASSSGKIGVGTSAAAAEPSLVGMTPAAATAVVGVTTLDSVVDSVVDATANSNNSAAVGLDASGSGVGGGGGRRNQERFVASTIRLGRATQAAAGLPDLMGYTDMSLLRLIDGHGDGIEAIMNEVNTSGSEEDKANLRGLLDGSYSNPPSGKDASPTPGELAAQRRTIDELMQSDQVKTAKLLRAHVLALRLYTTSTFSLINNPLRTDPATQPHPLAATTYFVSQGIKLLRSVAGELPTAHQPQSFWRGMKDLTISDAFLESGGTEFACMSTSLSREVAVDFAFSKAPMLLKLETKDFMSRGADISFLSAYPKESETLFPPLTFLRPIAKETVVQNGLTYLLMRCEPVLP